MTLKRFGSPALASLAFLTFGAALALVIPSCGTGSTEGGPGAGGNSSSTGTAGDGQGGTMGEAGSSGLAGTTGAAGSTGTGNGGSQPTAGTTGSGGSVAPTGSAGTTGTAGRGGTTGGAGTTGAAGRGGTTGAAGAAGTTGRGGTTGAAGTTGRGGTTGTAGTTGTGGSTAACTVPVGARCSGAQALMQYPFGCNFAWGRQNPSGTGSLSSYNYLGMVANWVENGISSGGTYTTCSGCTWLSSRVNGTNLIPVYYAYMIGFWGHMNGLPDQNQNPNGQNLATGGAALIKAPGNRQKILDMYAKYARDTYAVWKTKPLIWFLEGDFIQYAETSQGSPLTMAELGQLAADITCAIKGAMPNAVVAINHTTWNANEETTGFWCEMKRADYDMVWTTGVGNNGNFIESAGKAGYYNANTATYPYVHTLTGKTIAVDTSYGASAMSDSWSNQTAAILNNHIANGVIGVNISSNPPSNYQTLIQGLSLSRLPGCN